MAKAKQQSGGPFIGPKGGKWADAKHTIPWDEKKHGAKAKKDKPQPPDPRGPGAAPYKSKFKRYSAGQMGIPRANALDAMPEGSLVQIHGGSTWKKQGRNWVEHMSAGKTRLGDGDDIHADLYAYGGAVKDASKDMNKAEKIPGGLADGKSPAKYDQAQLKQGIKVEMEHTDDPAKAKEIAMDHLEEDPRYYTHLAEMERKHAEKSCDTPGEKKRSGGRGRGAAVGAGEGPINRRGDARKSMGGLDQLEDYLEKAKKSDPRQLGLFGGGAPKKKAVVRIGKRGGKIVGEDSKGNPIYEGSAAAKKLQGKAGGKGKPKGKSKVQNAQNLQIHAHDLSSEYQRAMDRGAPKSQLADLAKQASKAFNDAAEAARKVGDKVAFGKLGQLADQYHKHAVADGKAAESKEKARKADLGGYEDTLNPKDKANAVRTLNRPRMINGKQQTQKEAIQDMLERAAHVYTDSKGKLRIATPEGTFFMEKDLSKHAIKYAKHVLDNAKVEAPYNVTQLINDVVNQYGLSGADLAKDSYIMPDGVKTLEALHAAAQGIGPAPSAQAVAQVAERFTSSRDFIVHAANKKRYGPPNPHWGKEDSIKNLVRALKEAAKKATRRYLNERLLGAQGKKVSKSMDAIDQLDEFAKSGKPVVEFGKRGGKIVGRDSKGNPIYAGSEAAKKQSKKWPAMGKPGYATSGKGGGIAWPEKTKTLIRNLAGEDKANAAKYASWKAGGSKGDEPAIHPVHKQSIDAHFEAQSGVKKSMEDTMDVFETLGSFAETGDLVKAEDTPKMPEGGPHKLGEGAEKQMTDHRKPIENPKEVEAAKSLEPLAHARVMTPSVIRDTVAKERAEKVSALRKGEESVYVPTGAPRPSQAPQERPQGTVLRKGILVTDDSADRAIEEMLKSESFYTGGAPSLTAVVPLVQSKGRCPQCNSTMAKSLTACPECGHGTVQHRFVPAGPAVYSPDAGMEEGGNLHLRNPGLRRPKRQVVYIPDSE